MPCWRGLSQTPVNDNLVSRNVRIISSPHSRPWSTEKLFLQLVSLSWSRKTDAQEKHTKPKTVNLCSCDSSSWGLFLKPSSCFQSKFCCFELLNIFSPYEGLGSTCRSVMGVTARSPWPPPSMWLLHPTNLCHRIIVFKWSAHWQMMCDQF